MCVRSRDSMQVLTGRADACASEDDHPVCSLNLHCAGALREAPEQWSGAQERQTGSPYHVCQFSQLGLQRTVRLAELWRAKLTPCSALLLSGLRPPACSESAAQPTKVWLKAQPVSIAK